MTKQVNENIPTVSAMDIGLFASFKYVLVTIFGSIVKATQVIDTTLDVAQDCVDTTQIYSSSMKASASLTTEQQLAQLSRETNSEATPFN